jgi:hypothetical protein
MKRDTLIRQVFRLPQVLIAVIAFLLARLASKAPSAVEEIYSRKVYPAVRNAISAVTRKFPFSVAEIAFIALILVFVVLLVVRVIRLLCVKKGALVKLVSLVITYVLIAAYMVPVFYIAWGLNYSRQDVAVKLDLPEREYSVEELCAVCDEVLSKANELRAQVPTDENGLFTADLDSVNESLNKAYAAFGASRPSFKADVPPAKPVILSELMSKSGISGIYIPFTEEPNVNKNEPPLYLPFNAAHEMAHYLGYAHEEDANFIAFLVTSESSDPSVAYSGYMHALNHLARALAKADSAAYKELWDRFSEGVKRDLENYSAYYERYADTPIWDASEKANDAYLKANDQEKGVLSYEEDVALILRYYDSRRFFG